MSKNIKCFLRKKAKIERDNNLFSIKKELNLLHNKSFFKTKQITYVITLFVLFISFSTFSFLFLKKNILVSQGMTGENFVVSSYYEIYCIIFFIVVLISIVCLIFLIKKICKLHSTIFKK